MIIKRVLIYIPCGISQYILVEYLKDEVKYEKHLQEIRNDYKAKALYFSEQLKIILPEFKHETQKVGMFLYGSFGDKIDTFCTSTRVFKEKSCLCSRKPILY